ncbi:MAG TPA: class I SAM-dependent methyltransferase [Steroidobacteraceae bacterium]|nr:class I SAM-dependent methyltransferase [Steroidobacteraceae bacterium]
MKGDDPVIASLVDAASEPYRAAGRFAWHFARGKLKGDPAFAAILKRGLLTDSARILDLGCGQGLLASWLLAAQAARLAGRWPQEWPPPPAHPELLGVEINPREVARARAALGEQARIVEGDIRHVDYGSVDAIVILDVLHFTDHASQEAVLERARAALRSRGRLLLRVGDAEGGVGFGLSKLVDRIVALARRHRLPRLTCRPAREWRSLLTGLGFLTEALPMSQGTPFANVLLIGKLP